MSIRGWKSLSMRDRGIRLLRSWSRTIPAELARHSDLRTTQKYYHATSSKLRDVVNRRRSCRWMVGKMLVLIRG